MTREQARAIRAIRRRHNVERIYRERSAPHRVFVYVNDTDAPEAYANEVTVYPDGEVLGDNFDHAGFQLAAQV